MISKLLRYPGSKWAKHLVLSKETSVQEYLPSTAQFTKKSLIAYFRKYPVLFLKPSLGGGGQGIIKLSRSGNRFVFKTLFITKIVLTIDLLFLELHKLTGSKPYLIQQGITLLSIDQRPIDFRILLLRPESKWNFMGIMGKMAAKRKFVTNHCQGGAAITLNHALIKSMGFSQVQCKEMADKLQALGEQIADLLLAHFPRIRELGLDVAIDKEKRIWLIEANTRPQYQLFKGHEDKGLYDKINSQIIQLRRRKALPV